jgi:hypothetical protein
MREAEQHAGARVAEEADDGAASDEECAACFPAMAVGGEGGGVGGGNESSVDAGEAEIERFALADVGESGGVHKGEKEGEEPLYERRLSEHIECVGDGC